MRHLFLLSILIAVFVWTTGCQKEPVDPNGGTLEVEAIVAEQAAFGWQVNRMVLGAGEVAELTGNSQFVEEQGIDDLTSPQKMLRQGEQLHQAAQSHYNEIPLLGKPTGDSLVYFWENILLGIRKVLYYDYDTGFARYYEVRYKFSGLQKMIYDSTQIIADLNFTMLDPSDDRLDDLYRLQEFKPAYFVQKIVSQAHVTDFDGVQITGAEVSTDSWYHSSRPLSHLRQFAKMNPDHSGTLREDFDFRDGSTAFRSVTFLSNYTGTFEKQFRDGTTVQGSFNSIDDDFHGSYYELTDFPAGRYVDKIEKSVEVEITLPDSVFYADFAEVITFSNGNIDSALASISIQKTGDVKTTTITLHKPNGAFGTYVIQESDSIGILTGTWTTWDGYYILINAEYYADGSSHVNYEVYASQTAYDNGEAALLIADYYFSPDQTGSGTLSHNNETYNVEFGADGKATMRQAGKTARVNLF